MQLANFAHTGLLEHHRIVGVYTVYTTNTGALDRREKGAFSTEMGTTGTGSGLRGLWTSLRRQRGRRVTLTEEAKKRKIE